jgi:uncharacterized protein (TIGR03067 family)
MRQSVCLLAVVLLVVPSLGSDAPREYDGVTANADDLEGEWQVTAMTFNGIQVSFHKTVVAFHGGRYTETGGKRQEIGTYKVAAVRSPAELDITPSNGQDQGRTFRHIYRFEGDLLKLARRMNGGARPEDFQEEAVLLVTYKRVK